MQSLGHSCAVIWNSLIPQDSLSANSLTEEVRRRVSVGELCSTVPSTSTSSSFQFVDCFPQICVPSLCANFLSKNLVPSA